MVGDFGVFDISFRRRQGGRVARGFSAMCAAYHERILREHAQDRVS